MDTTAEKSIAPKQEQTEEFLTSIPDTDKERIVIIGGGFAGLELIKALGGSDYQVVMLDKRNFHTFQPLLYQVATAGLEPDSVSAPLREVVNGEDCFFRMAEVKRIEPKENFVETNLGKLRYDKLIMACGAVSQFFGNEDVEQSSFPLKEAAEAYKLRKHLFNIFEKAVEMDDPEELDSMLNVVVVGGGPTGLEVAGALSELKKTVLSKDYPTLDFSKMQIYLIEGLEQVVPAMSDFASDKAQHYLEKLGVRIRLETLVESVDGDKINLSDGSHIRSKTLVWAAGVKGNVIEGFKEETVEKSRLLVDPYFKVKEYENIYAVGDLAMVKTGNTPKGHPMLAPVAIQQGKHLAGNLLRISKGKTPKPFEYLNKGTMATIGRKKAVVDLPKNLHIGGFLAWLAWMFIHLMSLVGFRRKLVVLGNWIYSYFTYNKSTRAILDE